MTGTGPAIILSEHAAARLPERGIRPAWVVDAIRSPDDLGPDPAYPSDVWRYWKVIYSLGGKVLRVVARELPDGSYRVITALWDHGKVIGKEP